MVFKRHPAVLVFGAWGSWFRVGDFEFRGRVSEKVNHERITSPTNNSVDSKTQTQALTYFRLH